MRILGTYEKVYRTHSLQQRLEGVKSIYASMNDSHLATEYLEWYRSCTGGTAPYLLTYLDMAKYFNWDISRDINYAYATGRFGRGELRYRLQRIYPYFKHEIALEFCGHDLGLTPQEVHRVITLDSRSTLQQYGDFLQWVKSWEETRHYDNIIDLED